MTIKSHPLCWAAARIALCGWGSLTWTVSQATPTATPAPTPTLEPTPEPTLDMDALGAEYQAMATELFEITSAAYDLYNNATSPEEEAEANQALAEAYLAAATRLREMDFPAEAQADVDELVDVLDALTNEFEMALDLPGYENFDAVAALVSRLPEIGGRIRIVLGLPPPITAPPG